MESNSKGKTQKQVTEKVVEQAVEALQKNENVTLTILTGDAPNALQQYNPLPVEITGTIDAPARFCEVREFEQKQSHCLVSISKGSIKLIVNEQETINKFTVTGVIAIASIFTKLGINDASKSYTPLELANALKLRRSLFKNRLDHAEIIKTLRNIKGKVNQEIEAQKDNNGSKSEVFKQTVESNVPEAFSLIIPVIEGEEAKTIEVNVVLEVDNGEIICTLESIDGAEFIDEIREKAVLEQVEKIKDRTTVIFQ